jgi:peptidoglycan/LPS O-acetylase OafA/YrhL
VKLNFLKPTYDKNRIFGLDLLRAIAILTVMLKHGKYLLPDDFRPIHNYLNFDGVTIFFVLSGFLIGSIMIKSLDANEFHLGKFWTRRWLRTIPPYFFVLSLLVILEITLNNSNFLEFKNYYLFSQNFFNMHDSFYPEAWSLSVEEWFYLSTPVIILFLTIFFEPKKSVLITIISIIILITSVRYYRYLNIDIKSINHWALVFQKQVVTRLDSIMIGVFGAYIRFYFREFWNRIRKHALFMGILIFLCSTIIYAKFLIPYQSLFYTVFKFSITSLATLLLLPFLSGLESTSKSISSKIITQISVISYSMYLIHLTLVQRWIIEKIRWDDFITIQYLNWLVPYLLFWILTLILSIILYKYIEAPVMKFRDSKVVKRLFPKKKNKRIFEKDPESRTIL